jgi:ATP-dependent phosphoenolpyruvate carboxykinase
LGVKSTYGLENHGLRNLGTVRWDIPAADPDAPAEATGTAPADRGAAVDRHAAVDRYVARDLSTADRVWWNEHNRPMTVERAGMVAARVQAYLQGRDVLVVDALAGAAPELALPVRLVTTSPALARHASGLLVAPSDADRASFVPEFTVVWAPGFQASPEIDGTEASSFVVVSFDSRLVHVGGTARPDVLRRALFTVQCLRLTPDGVLPLRGVARPDPRGGVALVAGLDGAVAWGEGGVSDLEGTGISGPQAHPRCLVLLAHDPTGALPAIARLDPDRAAFHFLCGCSADGRGDIAFDPCFAGADLAVHPGACAGMLRLKLARHGTTCWLANAELADSSRLVEAAIAGELDGGPYRADDILDLDVPASVPDACAELRADLASRLATAFRKLADGCGPELAAACPAI